jgi:hypothetical protein
MTEEKEKLEVFMALVMPKSLQRRIDEWRRGHPDLPSRARAARLLLNAALDADPPPRNAPAKRKTPK